MFPSIDPVSTAAWQELANHFEKTKGSQLTELFKNDPDRLERLSFSIDDLFVDFSKNHVTLETIALFKKLAKEVGLDEAKEAMFTGEAINKTENRAVLHTALRNLTNSPIPVDGENVMPAVNKVLNQIKELQQLAVFIEIS